MKAYLTVLLLTIGLLGGALYLDASALNANSKLHTTIYIDRPDQDLERPSDISFPPISDLSSASTIIHTN